MTQVNYEKELQSPGGWPKLPQSQEKKTKRRKRRKATRAYDWNYFLRNSTVNPIYLKILEGYDSNSNVSYWESDSR